LLLYPLCLCFLRAFASKINVALQDRYRLVSVTYGPADSLAAMADGLLAILDAHQIEQVNVVGSSLGGYLAQYLLAAHPDRIARAVLANTFPPNEVIAQTYRLPTALLPYVPEWLVMAVMRASYRQRIYPTSDSSELVLAFLREISYGGFSKADINGRYQAVTEPFTPAATADLNIPLLIIETDNDPYSCSISVPQLVGSRKTRVETLESIISWRAVPGVSLSLRLRASPSSYRARASHSNQTREWPPR
jgi:pimeloyl-ACP methyl ester carboxylesterase